MANLTATRGAQEVLNASFVFNFDDQMVPISGGTAIAGTTRVDFGKTNIIATAFDIINLPLCLLYTSVSCHSVSFLWNNRRRITSSGLWYTR